MKNETLISERRACQLVGLSRTVLRYEPTTRLENESLRARLVELAGERRRFGYRRLHALIRREGKIPGARSYIPKFRNDSRRKIGAIHEVFQIFHEMRMGKNFQIRSAVLFKSLLT